MVARKIAFKGCFASANRCYHVVIKQLIEGRPRGQALGYVYLALDLEGYRTGSMNVAIGEKVFRPLSPVNKQKILQRFKCSQWHSWSAAFYCYADFASLSYTNRPSPLPIQKVD